MPSPHLDLVEEIRGGLRDAADAEKAPRMQSYMKSALPYHGVQAPGVQQICRRVFAEHRLTDRAVWEGTVRMLWDSATHREERYCAIALTGHRFYRDFQDPDTLPLYDHLIVSGAWWDFVDELASRRVGPLVRAYPGPLRPVLLAWSRDRDMWRRRTAILAQLQSKDETDVELLAAVIRPNLRDNEFFIHKAVGWALRQHARVDPDWVREYVDAHTADMAPLSRREATKHL